MKLDHKKIVAAVIGLTVAAGTTAYADTHTGRNSPRARAHKTTARPASSFNARTVNVNSNRNRNTNLNTNRNVNVNRNVNRNVNYNRNTNWHGGTAWHNGHWNNGVWHAGYWGAAAAAGAAVGAAAATAAALGSVAYSLPAGCGNVYVGGASYYQCGATWYQPQYMGGSTQYIVVNPPE